MAASALKVSIPEASLEGIRDVISGLRQTAQTGAEVVGRTITEVQAIAHAVEESRATIVSLNERSRQIASATVELSATSDQISNDIYAIDTVLRETLQATTAISDESQRLAGISVELQSELNQFQYDESQPTSHQVIRVQPAALPQMQLKPQLA